MVLIQVKSAAKRAVLGLKNKRENAFLLLKLQLFHIQVVRYVASTIKSFSTSDAGRIIFNSTWVSKAKPHALSSTELDAITGATPQNGVLTYKWDGTDDNGNRVPPGRYTFFIEGTLYWKSRVIYSGELDWGGREQDSIPVKVRYFPRPKPTGT